MKPTGYSSTFFLLCSVALCTMIGSNLLNPLLSIFAKGLGAGSLQIGIVVSGYWIARVLMEIPAGFLSARFGYYRLLVTGLSLSATGSFLGSLATDPYTLTLARAVTGLGDPLFFGVAMTFIVNLFDESRRGSSMGLFQGIEYLGSFLGASFSGYVVALLDFRISFVLSGVISTIAVVLVTLPRNLRKMEEKEDNLQAPALTLSSIRTVLKSRNLPIVSSSIFAQFILGTGVFITILPLYANQQLGMSLQEIGLLMGARSAGYTLFMFFMGYISDRVGRKPVLFFGLIVTGVLTILLSMAYTFPLLTLLIFFIGMSTGAIWIVCPVLAAEGVSPSERGPAIGTYRTFIDLGSVFGPIIMTATQIGLGFSACFYLSALILLANLVPTLGIRENIRKSEQRKA
jgi:MFS family permease